MSGGGGRRDPLPDVAQRMVRNALYTERRHQGLSRPAVAERLAWPVGKILEAEQGVTPLQPEEFNALAALYGLAAQRREELHHLVELSQALVRRKPDVAYE
jgi:hypothetical protein